ncbi:Integrator complex subunit 11 [Polyrhizophydium stewartii]|uniref:Integrator complex subunit 11 n=1 Tax=Polyrhizophydium stewartii TaxID=2732419 RepID=A0ABR4N958_9FUNG
MFDCGMHMGFSDHRRFPDFSYISKTGDFTAMIDCVIISHFHLDHCGALPYFTEMCGYDGPVYMTHPTKAIAPILLEDMRKVVVERKGETDFFNSADIKNCMRKVIGVGLLETVRVDAELEIRPYYAGHVLGAAMFHVRVTDGYGVSQSVVYTGDYNMTPDRHLGAAQIDACEPDLIITETTYATTIRDSKRARERDFLKKVHDCVRKGGKVLIPVFALGRAQELLILIESYWRRMDDLSDKVPVYFSTGLTERANEYYKLFISWTNENVKSTFVERNMFDFSHVRPWDHSYAEEPGAMVLFATPGMLHAGTSLEVFKKWCHDPKNMVILPGYCVAGTVGAKVLAGEKIIDYDRFNKLHVNLQVTNLSFSAHADAKGIMQLIRASRARNVMLVHGEKHKMAMLRKRIEREIGIPCFDPPNGVTIHIPTQLAVPALVSEALVSEAYGRERPKRSDLVVPRQRRAGGEPDGIDVDVDAVRPIRSVKLDALMVIEPPRPVVLRALGRDGKAVVVGQHTAPAEISLLPLESDPAASAAAGSAQADLAKGSADADVAGRGATRLTLERRYNPLVMAPPGMGVAPQDIARVVMSRVYADLQHWLGRPSSGDGTADVATGDASAVHVASENKGMLVRVGETVHIAPSETAAHTLEISWSPDDEDSLAVRAIAIVNRVLQQPGPDRA